MRITGTSASERVVPTGRRPRARSSDRELRAFELLLGRTFTSDEDLNDQARHWLEVANVRTHGTLKERPVDRFEHDRLAALGLAPIPILGTAARGTKQAKAVLPRIDVERRPLEAYAQVAGGVGEGRGLAP